jgi:RimJ/RimL family protein N-acetyltransferase
MSTYSASRPYDGETRPSLDDVIRGERVILRPKRLEDAALDYAWRCDPELCRFDAVQPLTIAFETFLAGYREDLRDPGIYRRRFAIETLDGRHIGNCSLYNIDRYRREAELGIMIGDKAYWNQGYGHDAVQALVRYGFERLGLDRIYLYSLAWNVRAQASFRKVGFVERRRVREMGQEFVIMDITRAEFQARSREPA